MGYRLYQIIFLTSYDLFYKISHMIAQAQRQVFCFMLIREPASLFLATFYLILLLIIFAFTAHQVHKLGTSPIMTIVSGIYFFLLLWSGCCFAEVLLGLYAYFKYQYQDEDQGISITLFFLTFAAMFLLHTVLMLAPYNWHKNMIQYMGRRIRDSGLSEHQIEDHWDNRLRTCLKFWLPTRQILIIIWAVTLIIFIPLHNPPLKIILAHITMYMVVCDSFVLLCIFCMGKYALSKNHRLHEQLQQGQLLRIATKYNFLILSSILRVLVYTIRTFVEGLSIQFSECKSKRQENGVLFILLFVQAFLIDFLAGSSVLGMYYFRKEERVDGSFYTDTGHTDNLIIRS